VEASPCIEGLKGKEEQTGLAVEGRQVFGDPRETQRDGSDSLLEEKEEEHGT